MADERSWTTLIAGVAVAGGIGWVVDTSLLWLLATVVGVATPLAAAAGFLASGFVNFLVNRAVFAGPGAGGRQQATRYVLLFGLNLGLVSLFVPLLASALGGTVAREGVRLILAKIVVTAALLVPNTLCYRHWVFRSAGPAAH